MTTEPTTETTKTEPETVTLTKEEYEYLVKAEERLSALEEMGVDNWEGYSEAMKLMRQRAAEAAAEAKSQ
jgi:PHD/YefM family antitoxin component YafN of YafNO toxin-antitoxin module